MLPYIKLISILCNPCVILSISNDRQSMLGEAEEVENLSLICEVVINF